MLWVFSLPEDKVFLRTATLACEHLILVWIHDTYNSKINVCDAIMSLDPCRMGLIAGILIFDIWCAWMYALT